MEDGSHPRLLFPFFIFEVAVLLQSVVFPGVKAWREMCAQASDKDVACYCGTMWAFHFVSISFAYPFLSAQSSASKNSKDNFTRHIMNCFESLTTANCFFFFFPGAILALMKHCPVKFLCSFFIVFLFSSCAEDVYLPLLRENVILFFFHYYCKTFKSRFSFVPFKDTNVGRFRCDRLLTVKNQESCRGSNSSWSNSLLLFTHKLVEKKYIKI